MATSRVIFENQHYTACALRDGSLCVTSNHNRRGVRLVGPQAETWIKAIETADDYREANTLCKAVLALQ